MENLPHFPTFRRITLEDRGWYDEFYAGFQPYADFSFGNLLIWLDQRNDLSASRLNGNIILRCTTLYMDDQIMFNILGDSLIDETIGAIFAFQQASSLKQNLLGLPEFVVKHIQRPNLFNLAEDRDNFEYVIDTRLVGYLEGPTMKRVRQDVNGYERRAGLPVTVEELDLGAAGTIDYLRGNVASWEKAFSTNDTASQEQQVIERTFEIAAGLGYKNLSVKVGDELAGFALYQPVPYNNIVIVNHLKTSYHYRHTSFYLAHHLGRMLSDQGIAFMNFEQDLGLAGLRDFKMKLRPAYLLPKYNATPAVNSQ